jgi:hypothetical protein
MVLRPQALRQVFEAFGPVVPHRPIIYRTSQYVCPRSHPAAHMATVRPPEQGASFRLAPPSTAGGCTNKVLSGLEPTAA